MPGKRLGRLKSPPNPHRERMAKHFDAAAVPTPPASYDWSTKVGPAWGMMLNDRCGDCAIAGPGHMVMCWTANASGKAVVIPDRAISDAYFALSPRDQGCNMEQVLEYWATTGIGGHRVLGWAPVDPANDRQVLTLGWLCGGLYAGAELPNGGTDGGSWTVPCSGDIGGHAFAPVADDGRNERVVTWGQLWTMSGGFRKQRVDELYAVLSAEWFGPNGRTPHGYTPSQMAAFLVASGGHVVGTLPPDPGPAPTPAPPNPGPGPGPPSWSYDAFA